MINKSRWSVAVIILVIASIISSCNRADDKLPVALTAMQTSKGWGYEIFVDGKIFIKQPYIPVIAGEQGFKSKEQALAVGNIAVKKIVMGKTPVITKDELKSLQILE